MSLKLVVLGFKMHGAVALGLNVAASTHFVIIDIK